MVVQEGSASILVDKAPGPFTCFGFVYMLHFASYIPDIGRYEEYKQGTEKYAGWFDPPLTINDGKITVPQSPGVGIVNTADLLKDAERVV